MDPYQYFQNEVYGYIPDPPERVCGEVIEENPLFAAGKATLQTVKITAIYKGQSLQFPIRYCFPNNGKENKTVVALNFSDAVPDKYIPAEEIIDGGGGRSFRCTTKA